MQHITISMMGGMLSSTVLTLIVVPAVYGIIRGWRLPSETNKGSVERPMPVRAPVQLSTSDRAR